MVVSRVRGIGPAAVQGLLIALPFTLIMVLLTFVSTIRNTAVSDTAHIRSAGVGFVDLLFWALLTSALLGMLGGIYEASGQTVLLAVRSSERSACHGATQCTPQSALCSLFLLSPAGHCGCYNRSHLAYHHSYNDSRYESTYSRRHLSRAYRPTRVIPTSCLCRSLMS